MPVNPVVRNRLESQGYCGLDDAALLELAPWLRWIYSLGGLITIIGVALMSPAVLWSLAAITLLGIVVPFQPFDLLYNYGARYLTGTRPFPKQAPVRRFVFGVAFAWLLATGWAFYGGSDILGFALGVTLILVAVLASTTHFCVPSWIYNGIFDRAGQRRQAGV
jgi:Domain of unknown function (DUF4395)